MIDIAALVDLTLLKGDETEESMAALCSKAVKHHVAAVCVYPEWVARCVELLMDNSGVKVASVVNFPHGDDTLQETLSVIEKLKKDGADEVDVVLPYHRWLNGDREYAKKFISFCKECCGNKVLLKCILETGELKEAALIYDASLDALTHGADFIKTSTGKTSVSATYDAASVMIKAIKDYGVVGKGIKVSGGIKTKEQAEAYIKIAADIMGDEFIRPSTFRFGASSLVENL